MPNSQRIDYLDGIRAVAIVAVILDHWGFLWGSPFRGGYIGVDLFFVLSGYIITTLTRRSGGRFSYRAFLAARVRRLYPALIGLVVIVVPLSACLSDQGLPQAVTAGVAALLQANTFRASVGMPVSPFGLTWSLSAEWCAYLSLPWLLLLLRRFRASTTSITLLALGVMLYGASASLLPAGWFYYGPTARTAELIVGAALAVAVESPPRFLASGRWSLAAGAFGIGVLVTWSVLGGDELGGTYRHVGVPLGVAAAAALITCGLGSDGGGVARGLASAPFAGLGRASYSLYLWHSVPLAIEGPWSSGLDLSQYLLVSAAFVLLMTALSARYLERRRDWGALLAGTGRAILRARPGRVAPE